MTSPAIVWVRARRCNGYGGNACVEVARVGGETLVRDSKLGERSPVLSFGPGEWRRFIDAAKAGEFDFF